LISAIENIEFITAVINTQTHHVLHKVKAETSENKTELGKNLMSVIDQKRFFR